MPLPDTVTGTATLTSAWPPDAAPSSPLVVAGAGAAAGAGAEVSAPLLDESPMTEMLLPDTVTGRSTDTIPCVPDSSPSFPDVSAACATPAPRTAMPPPTSAPRSALFMNVRIMSS